MKRLALIMGFCFFSANAAADTLNEVEVTVLNAEDIDKTDEVRIVIKSNRGGSDSSDVTLSAGDSELIFPGLYGQKFTVQIWEKDRATADEFFGTTVIQGVGSGSKVVTSKQGRYEIRWTVSY